MQGQPPSPESDLWFGNGSSPLTPGINRKEVSSAQMGNNSEKKWWLLSGFGLVAVFFVLTFDLVAMRCVFKWDAWNLFWPLFYRLVSSLEAGRLPLWDTCVWSGFPFHADPLTGTFYPINVLIGYVFGGGFRVYQSLWLLHWLWGIVGMFFLCKRMGLSPSGAFVASVTFGFNGFFLLQAQHSVHVFTVSYVPWVLLLLDRAYEARLWYALPAGILLGLAGLGGHPGMTILATCAVVLWCLLRYGLSLRTVTVLSAALALSVVVLSPAYVSFLLECGPYSDRATSLSVREACTYNSFPLSGLISLIVPAFPLTYPEAISSGGDAVLEVNAYCGIFALSALVAVALDDAFRKRWKWLLLFMLIVFLFSLGSTGGLRVITYYVLPPLRFVRHTSIARVFWMMGAAIIAGWVFDRLVSASSEQGSDLVNRSLKALGVFLCMGLCALCWSSVVPETALVSGPQGTMGMVANSFVTALKVVGIQLVLMALFLLGVYLLKTSVAKSLATSFLLVLIVLDASVHFHTTKDTVCWNGDVKEFAETLERVGNANRGRLPNPNEQRIVNCAPLNMWVFDRRPYVRGFLGPTSKKYDTLVGNTWMPCHETKFLPVLAQGPRFWLTPHVVFAEDHSEQALALLRDTDGSAGVPVYVHEQSAGATPTAGQSIKPGTYGKVEVLTYESERLSLRVDAPADCWLFCTERFAPGWNARLDGQPVELFKANFCFRAVRVPRGAHTVTMEYVPWIYKPTMLASWGVIVLVLGFWGVVSVSGIKVDYPWFPGSSRGSDVKRIG